MSLKKIDVGIGVLRDEAECAEGWARMMLNLCERVVCMLDITDGKTAQIVSKFPEIALIAQNRHLGDSDDSVQGPELAMIAHANLECAVNSFVKEGQWFLLMAADERIDPIDYETLLMQVNELRVNPFYTGINFVNFHHFTPDGEHCFDFQSKFKWGHLIQCRIQAKGDVWHKGLPPHSGMDVPDSMFFTQVPIYHYCYMKTDRAPFKLWRDQPKLADAPTYQFKNPLVGWRTMEMLK